MADASDGQNITPPHWKKPDEVMRLHRLKMKKRALQTRLSFNSTQNTTHNNDRSKSNDPRTSRNPFRVGKKQNDEDKETKRPKLQEIMDETSTDGTLFRLLNYSQTSKLTSQPDAASVSFTDALSKLINTPKKTEKVVAKAGEKVLPVDWTLRVKVRLMLTKAFPWNEKVKTCEESSGTTGFVRCLDTTSNKEYTLDTSPNARFYQCCLVWQHPSLPWLDLYPRIGAKSFPGSLSTSNTSPNISLLSVKDSLHTDWMDSFRSLFQLVRAKQCPYFYVISNTFTCLFRAAGIASYNEINALLTPTTRGFRQMLKEEDIEYTMPLRTRTTVTENILPNKNALMSSDSLDSGYDSLDLASELEDANDEILPHDLDDDDETEQWLQNMGVEESEIKRLNSSQFDVKLSREKQIDNMPESLIFVDGSEVNALFNFLMNCKSIIPTTGPFTGVPPTLVAPVAFAGSTLRSLKVRQSMVKKDGTCYHSMEIKGPILPHNIHNLCDLMNISELDQYSLTCANIESTKSFSLATTHQILSNPDFSPTKTPKTHSVFGQQNLTDCGFRPSMLSTFCSGNIRQYDSVKFSDGHYLCE